jgi:hypothetical protein
MTCRYSRIGHRLTTELELLLESLAAPLRDDGHPRGTMPIVHALRFLDARFSHQRLQLLHRFANSPALPGLPGLISPMRTFGPSLVVTGVVCSTADAVRSGHARIQGDRHRATIRVRYRTPAFGFARHGRELRCLEAR